MGEELSYYNYIQTLPHLNQNDIDKLYESENIYRDDLDKEIDKISKELGLYNIFGKLNKDVDISEEDYDKLEKLRIERFHRLINGKKSIKRNYPSTILVNKIVEGNLWLALIYSYKYYKKVGDDYSFDDLFQMSSEALINAAKYYVPNSIAKFSTYAGRCIDNKLKREIYKKENKQYIKSDFFTSELSKFDLINTLINCIDKCTLNFKDSTLYVLNKAIRAYNKKMYNCFSKTLPLFKNGSTIKDVIDLYNYLIKDSYINELVDNDDLDFIKFYVSINELDYNLKTIKIEREKVKLYMFKIFCIKELNEFEKKYIKDNNGNVPSVEEQYEFLVKNQKILRRSNSNRVRFFKEQMSLTNFRDVYLEKYGIDLLGYDNENRVYERKVLEGLYNACLDQIKNLDGKADVSVLLYDCYGITIPSLRVLNKSDLIFMCAKKLSEEECKKLCNDFIEKYNSSKGQTLFVNECIKSRVKIVSEYIKDINADEVSKNREALDFINSMQFYKSKISKKDFESICKARVILYSLDDSFEAERLSRDKKLSVEEQVEVNAFLDTYYNVLSGLSEEERKVMLLSFDENGYKLFNNKEIAFRLNMSTNKVRGIKVKSLNKIKKSELRNYLDIDM